LGASLRHRICNRSTYGVASDACGRESRGPDYSIGRHFDRGIWSFAKLNGARTAWHTHPLGQTLIVTAGCGLVQIWDGPIEEICPGDVVWIPPGEKHWHGATPTTAMTHIAI